MNKNFKTLLMEENLTQKCCIGDEIALHNPQLALGNLRCDILKNFLQLFLETLKFFVNHLESFDS